MLNGIYRVYVKLKRGCRPRIMGAALEGDWGTANPQKNLRWGTAHVSVPPIFREVVLLDA